MTQNVTNTEDFKANCVTGYTTTAAASCVKYEIPLMDQCFKVLSFSEAIKIVENCLGLESHNGG